MPTSDNIYPHERPLLGINDTLLSRQKGTVIWLTGLSGSGKSTIAIALLQKLSNAGYLTYLLDGDNIRTGLNADLGFSPPDRKENIRRISEVARLFSCAGLIVPVSFISPYRDDRNKAREVIGEEAFIEVFVEASVATCELRDPKGLYAKARDGIIKEFTGISAPYEEPESPDLVLNTQRFSAEKCAENLFRYLLDTERITER